MKCKFIKFKLILLLVISIFLLGSFVVTAQSIKKGKPISKMNTDLFHLKLNYEINTVSNTPRFNGAISSTQWRTKAGPRNAYTYHYDSRDQLVEANYWEATNSAQYVKSNEFQTAPITYDLNGNILSLKRQDELNSLIIDDLSYVYEVDNQLLSIEEVGDLTEGFHADQSVNTYQYDLNGNLISDQSKNITNIEYNHLNLPAIIKFSDGSELQFTYNASGKKIRKRYLLSSSQTIKDYCHEIEYYNNSLEAIYHENGRSVSNTSDWQEEFFIADHLGSPRVYFADLNDNYKIESSEL
ncbi:MAG: hypothetical protein MRY83_01080, partial [Flavobacteriales bacterium]|nr:hypothetical protein [Flavobacteriales bacterium]